MVRIKVPDGTFPNSLGIDENRPFPSMECLTNEEKKELGKRVDSLVDFHSKSKLAFQAVASISNWLSEQGFEQRDIFSENNKDTKNYFYLDPWQKSSLIVVKEGKKPITEGFHLINSHADSPCLKIKSRPLRIEGDKDKLYNYLGVRLSTIPHGGIVIPHWVGQPVKIMGYTINKDGTRKEISFLGSVEVNSAHIDYSNSEQVEHSFSPEKSLEITTGYAGVSNLLDSLSFESPDDFANTHLWAVPTNNMISIDEHSKNLLVGYGHDNRTTVFSAIDSIIKTKNPEYTSIVWISDNEEIGDPSPVGTDGPFFKILLEKIIGEQEINEKRKISKMEIYQMYSKSKMINGDVTIAPSRSDEEDNMDYQSSAKIGLGAVIEELDISGNNLHLVRYLRNLASESGLEKRLCHQLCGQFYNQDKVDLWYSSAPNGLSSKGIPKISVGIPCASCHSPVEIICPGDEYATSKLYKRFFEGK